MTHDFRFCVAPMMDWTDRHCRAFHRSLSQHARLYSEMITADAIIHGDRERLLGFSAVEHPLAIQLGGNEPEKLYKASKISADWGYDEVNLNCGCPSSRVKSGAFGAILMRQPELVAECIAAMQSGAPKIPATVKCRIAIDEDPERETLWKFVETIHETAGCTVFIVHARKAWLDGLSPKENRDIPPLNYALVAQLKAAFPHLTILLNGGVETLTDCAKHLETFDGVMLGRAAYQNPSILLGVDALLANPALPENHITFDTRLAALARFRPYVEQELARGTRLHAMTRHILGLFNGMAGARLWRRVLSEEATKDGAGIHVLDKARDTIIDIHAKAIEKPLAEIN